MLSLTVSFEKKIFYGSAHLVVKKLGPHAREVVRSPHLSINVKVTNAISC